MERIFATQCYTCENFDTSEDCMNITECGNNEVCYARADGTSTGKVKYTVGCTRDMSALREDLTFCTNVCVDDLCNLEQCNIPISPNGNKERPPRCMSCELIDNPDACTNFVQCNENEICFVRELSVYGNKKFRMGCMNTMHCTGKTSSSVNPGIIVGKRLTDVNNISSADCAVCCDRDNCNTLACDQNQTSSIGTIQILKMIGETSCSNTNDDSCAAFGLLDADACVKLPKVDELCPKTCGICGHFGWAQWSDWSDCSKTCSQGTATRRRDCLKQVAAANSQNCPGVSIETKSCSERLCLHEGSWSNWQSWGQCSRSCSNGTKTRLRYCIGSNQVHGSLFCRGDHYETSSCNIKSCPVCPSSSWIEQKPSCYLFAIQKMTFTAAQNYCHARNASLVHIESTAENSFVVSSLRNRYNYYSGWWLGITDSVIEGRWRLTDLNKQLNFTYWEQGQPDNKGIDGSENCAVFLTSFHYKWNDVGCSEQYSVICEIFNV